MPASIALVAGLDAALVGTPVTRHRVAVVALLEAVDVAVSAARRARQAGNRALVAGLDTATRVAAVTGVEVAVVAALGELDDAIATHRGDEQLGTTVGGAAVAADAVAVVTLLGRLNDLVAAVRADRRPRIHVLCPAPLLSRAPPSGPPPPSGSNPPSSIEPGLQSHAANSIARVTARPKRIRPRSSGAMVVRGPHNRARAPAARSSRHCTPTADAPPAARPRGRTSHSRPR